MGDSKARQKRMAEKVAAERRRLEAKKTAPPPEPPALAAAPEEPEEINFLLMPGGMLTPEGVSSYGMRKSVRPTAPMDAYIKGFQSRHRIFKFATVAIAVWRILVKEEHEALEAARREQRRTGVPPRPVMGPFYKAVAEEIREMRAEESGEIFDD